jgi:hypothetical protein
MATLRVTIQSIHDSDAGRSAVFQEQVSIDASASPSMGELTVTEAAPVSVPLGNVATARYLYAQNKDAANYIQILDDATEIARLLAGESCFIPLPDGVDLKAQADTADCEMIFAVYGAA